MKRGSTGMAAAAMLGFALSACGGGGGGDGNRSANAVDEAVLTGEDQLTADPSVADEAAADEAADMNLFGGNAAAGETGNAAAAPAGGNGL